MAIKLGKNPKDFKKTINVETIDGITDTLSITYIYRSPEQLAELLDERTALIVEAVAAEAAATQPKDGKQGIKEGYINGARESAKAVLDIATGWDLDDAFTADNLLILEGQFPGVLLAIQARYQQAVTEVRVKN